MREKIPASDFIFPDKRSWPIHDIEHGKIALVWSTWPQHKNVAKEVRDAVFKRYTKLKDWFKGGKYKKESLDVVSGFLDDVIDKIKNQEVK